MRIDEALKLSDVAVTPTGDCVYKSAKSNWYYRDGKTYPLHEISLITGNNINWQPAYIRPQFEIGEKVSFLQACLSGQCFQKSPDDNVRRCVDLVLGRMQLYHIVTKKWILSAREFCTFDTVTIVADPSQEQPKTEKRQRTQAEIVADIKTLVSELENARSG